MSTVAPPRQHLPANLAERAYLAVKELIFDFRLMPGERFSESELASRLALSRTPLRQALQRLEHEGFLAIFPKSGCRIAPLDFDRFDELYDFRILIECHAVRRLCAADGAREVLGELAQTWHVPVVARCAEGDRVRELDERFHHALVLGCGNGEMARVHHDLTERIRIVRRLDFTQAPRIEATYLEHGKILRAVMQRRPDEAVRLLRAHIEHSKLAVRQISLGTLDRLRRAAPDA